MVNRVAVIRVPASVDVPPASIPAPEWNQSKADVNAISHNTFDPVNYGAKRDDPSEASANVAAIQAAADNAESAGGTLVIKGTFWINDTVRLRCHVDGTSGTLRINVPEIAPAVLVGSTGVSDEMFSKVIALPDLINAAKGGVGWDNGSTGYEIANAYSCHITTRHVQGFAVNVRISAYGTGNVYNEYHIGWLDNGRINLLLQSGDAAGWVNENKVFGGRYFHEASEGVNVAGTRQIALRQNGTWPLDNNLFIGPSVEGNTAQYHVEFNGASYNTILQGRWEATTPKAHYTNGAAQNVVLYGYNAHSLVQSGTVGYNPVIHTRGGSLFATGTSGGHVYENGTAGDAAVLSVMNAGARQAGADPAAAYMTQLSARYARWKAAADTQPRVQVDGALGTVAFGDGASAPDATLSRVGTAGIRSSKKVLAVEGLGTGGYTAGAPSGSPTGSIPIYDANGTLLGRIPVY